MTRKAPELIAKYFLDVAKQIYGRPKIIKADDGNKHSVIEPFHVYFNEVTFLENKLLRVSKTAWIAKKKLENKPEKIDKKTKN